EQTAKERLLRPRMLLASAFAYDFAGLEEDSVEVGQRMRVVPCPAILQLNARRVGRDSAVFAKPRLEYVLESVVMRARAVRISPLIIPLGERPEPVDSHMLHSPPLIAPELRGWPE